MKYLLMIKILFFSMTNFQCNEIDQEKGKKVNEKSEMKIKSEIEEDVIFIKDAKLEDLKKAIKEFCRNYNQGGKVAFPNLNTIDQNTFSITFRKPIPLDVLGYLVNYLHYPFEIKHYPKIRAWKTIESDVTWVGKELHNKRVMLYIPENDDEYDNVFFITKENNAYKDSFRAGETLRKVDEKTVKFESADEYFKELEIKETIEFE